MRWFSYFVFHFPSARSHMSKLLPAHLSNSRLWLFPLTSNTAHPVQFSQRPTQPLGKGSREPESESIQSSDLISGDQGMIKDSINRAGFLLNPHSLSSIILPQLEQLPIFTGARKYFPYWFSLLLENLKH